MSKNSFCKRKKHFSSDDDINYFDLYHNDLIYNKINFVLNFIQFYSFKVKFCTV